MLTLSCNIGASEKRNCWKNEYWTKTDPVFKYSRHRVTDPLVTGNIQLPDFQFGKQMVKCNGPWMSNIGPKIPNYHSVTFCPLFRRGPFHKSFRAGVKTPAVLRSTLGVKSNPAKREMNV